jgi:4-diphosphocytidyl-2-C-methyl-D-erythritol kinase
MLLFPHAKINLGLNVVRRRDDGYHDLQSIMVPIPLHDALEAVLDPTLDENNVVFTRSGIPVPGDPDRDLCMKAVDAVRAIGNMPGIRLHLHKAIPMGAGLGGGSSDGTHTLLLLNSLLGLGLRQEQLHRMATALGSDCPFFLTRNAQLAEGRGERLRAVPLDLKGYWLVLVNPGIHVSTAEVFGNTTPTGTEMQFDDLLLDRPLEYWDQDLRNTMEPYVLNMHPEVGRIKEKLRSAGAGHCAMSGSGSSVFGIFRTPPPKLEWPGTHASWTMML